MARKKPQSPTPSGRLSAYRPVLDVLIFALGLFGVLVTIHLWIQQNRGFDQGCFGFTTSEAIEETFDCEAVVSSGAGQFIGISNVFWGLAFYLGVVGLSVLVAFAAGKTLKQLKIARASLITIGLLYSLYLAYYQYVVINEFCALCLTSALTVTLLFAVQLIEFVQQNKRDQSTMPFMKKMRQSSVYGILAVLAVVLIGADIIYFNSLGAPQEVQAQPVAEVSPEPENAQPTEGECVYNPEIEPVDNYTEMISFSDPMKGRPDAPVTVIEFFDPNCGHCRIFHPTMKKIIAENEAKAQFFIRPFVLNPQTLSMVQVEALYAAAQEGKYFEMLDRQFARQQRGGLSLAQLKEIATEIGMDPNVMEQRIRSGMYRQMVLQLRQQIIDAGINSVPTVMVNGRVIATQSRTEACIEKFINDASAQ